MSDELLKTVNPVKLKLDREYELSVVNLNTMVAIEEEFGCSIAELKDKFEQRQAGTLRSLAYILIKDKYPDITKERIGELVTVKNLQQVAETVLKSISDSLGE